MLYYLFKYLNELNVPGAGMFNYISFRSALAVITSLIISLLIGKRIIELSSAETGRGRLSGILVWKGSIRRKGTPSMGGVIILASIIVPVILFARLDNTYVILMLLATVWLGLIGFLDDYIKVFRKNKEGLAGRFKIPGQIVAGLVVWLFCISTREL